MPRLNNHQRQQAVELHDAGLSFRQIAAQLSCTHWTISKTIRRHKKTGSVADRPKAGRPRATDDRTDRGIVRASRKDPFKTASDLRAARGLARVCSIWTIQRRLRAAGLYARAAGRKPLVSRINQRRRLEFARQHQFWTAADWRRIVFRDESKINRLGSNGRRFVRRPSGQAFALRHCIGTLQAGGGSIMVWGAISANGPGPLVRLSGNINARDYVDMLTETYLPYAEEKLPVTAVFMQDNAPIHRANIVEHFFRHHRVTVLDWPAQSPDLNPIENVWAYVKRHLRQRTVNNLEHIWQSTLQIWNNISPDFCRRLIENMPRRMAAVIKSRGGPTKY